MRGMLEKFPDWGKQLDSGNIFITETWSQSYIFSLKYATKPSHLKKSIFFIFSGGRHLWRISQTTETQFC
jgi:hypothetical protein